MKLLTGCCFLLLANLLLCHAQSLAQSNDPVIFRLPPVDPTDNDPLTETLANAGDADQLVLNAHPSGWEYGQTLLAKKDEITFQAEKFASEIEFAVVEKFESEKESQCGWFSPSWGAPFELWDGGIEVGINGAHGNTNMLSLTTGINLTRTDGPSEMFWELIYLKTETNEIETQHNAILKINYDLEFKESDWTWFAKFFGVYDEFKAFDVRLSVNTGAGYNLVKTDTKQMKFRIGAGWSREINGPDDRYVPEATFGIGFERELPGQQKLVLDSQYLPEWEDFSFYRMINDAHWKILLHEASDLHLKIGIIDRYDSTPNGADANDLTYSLLLLWKI